MFTLSFHVVHPMLSLTGMPDWNIYVQIWHNNWESALWCELEAKPILFIRSIIHEDFEHSIRQVKEFDALLKQKYGRSDRFVLILHDQGVNTVKLGMVNQRMMLWSVYGKVGWRDSNRYLLFQSYLRIKHRVTSGQIISTSRELAKKKSKFRSLSCPRSILATQSGTRLWTLIPGWKRSWKIVTGILHEQSVHCSRHAWFVFEGKWKRKA